MKKFLTLPAEIMAAMDTSNFSRYRTDNKKFLERAAITCPKFKDYAKIIVNYYQKNKNNPKLITI